MKKGRCHICQKESNLTFEHIPPHKAFNYQSARIIVGEELMKTICDENKSPWDYSDLKYVQKQRGVGMHSLCSRCNNLTGKYYGNEYIKFANTVDILFPEILKRNEKIAGISIEGMNPLLFAKQVLSMFCSTCPHITKKYPEIIELLLNKSKRGIDTNKLRLSMFLLKERRIAYTGVQAMWVSNMGIRVVASIDAYPFGFLLEFDPKIECVELDITSFLNDYEDTAYNMNFGIPILERNMPFSTDYRTKEEIMACVEENKRKEKENE